MSIWLRKINSQSSSGADLTGGEGFLPTHHIPLGPGTLPAYLAKGRPVAFGPTHSLFFQREHSVYFPLCLCLCLSVLTEFSIKDRRKWATWFPQGRQVCWCALLLVLIFNTLGLLSQPKLEAFLNKQQLAAEVHSRKERRRKDRSGMWGNQSV